MAVLKEALRNFTFANQLTFLRLIGIPFFIICVLTNQPGIALLIFLGADVTDLFDGLIARYLKQTTALGAFRPVADKLLLVSGLVCLTIPDHPKLLPAYEAPNHIPIQLTILSISRDTFIVTTAIILYLVTPIRRFPPTLLGKITTCAEMVTTPSTCTSTGVQDSGWWITPPGDAHAGMSLGVPLHLPDEPDDPRGTAEHRRAGGPS
jgi:phosphatidylglycerophosphate synthase